jgi:altronate dehydratase
MALIDPGLIPAPHPESILLDDAAVRLHPLDQVAIARRFLHPGTRLRLEVAQGGGEITLAAPIPAGHKLALIGVPAGGLVRRYGQVIGIALQPITPGDPVHVHNLGLPEEDRSESGAAGEFGVDAHPVDYIPETERRTFLGYPRSKGSAGTRNLIAVIATVNCAAHTSREIAHFWTPERLAEYPNVDGVIALTHTYGCASRVGHEDYQLLARTLMGMARHPNVGAAVIVSLGCETNQPVDLLHSAGIDPAALPVLVIQEQGGIRKTIQAGIEAVKALLPRVNAIERTPQPVSKLMVALQCGGSDAWSGVTANPALGKFSDLLVRQGGTVVLAETTEIYGAEHLLLRRAANPEVARRLLNLVRWWEKHARQHGISIDNNRSTGNAAGGLTTIYEKSLGAVAKAGSTLLNGVYQYAEPVTCRGFAFMDSPGYDPVSVTGQVAGGCNLVIFTTGRGSAFGFKPAPSIKVSTNTPLYQRMIEDMDFNAGQVLEGESIEQAGADLFELAVAVASGQPSKSEAQGVGEAEFAPWQLGSLL